MYKHNKMWRIRKLNFEIKFGSKQNPASKKVYDLDGIDREHKDIIGDSSAKCQSIMHEVCTESFIILK